MELLAGKGLGFRVWILEFGVRGLWFRVRVEEVKLDANWRRKTQGHADNDAEKTESARMHAKPTKQTCKNVGPTAYLSVNLNLNPEPAKPEIPKALHPLNPNPRP